MTPVIVKINAQVILPVDLADALHQPNVIFQRRRFLFLRIKHSALFQDGGLWQSGRPRGLQKNQPFQCGFQCLVNGLKSIRPHQFNSPYELGAHKSPAEYLHCRQGAVYPVLPADNTLSCRGISIRKSFSSHTSMWG